MSERYYAKREAGLSPVRSDGSVTSPETDRQSAAAEEFAAEALGAAFNAEVYATHGDGGHDFVVTGKKGTRYTVEVIWLGMNEVGVPRDTGHLIVNPHEPQRWADLYVSVPGSIETGFRLAGWISHNTLVALPLKNFGFGDRFACHIDNLSKFKAGTKRDVLWYVNKGRAARGAEPLAALPSFNEKFEPAEIPFGAA